MGDVLHGCGWAFFSDQDGILIIRNAGDGSTVWQDKEMEPGIA